MNISTSSSLLINEAPLQVLPSLAVALKNVHEAIILQQVQYWLSRSNFIFNNRNGYTTPWMSGMNNSLGLPKNL